MYAQAHIIIMLRNTTKSLITSMWLSIIYHIDTVIINMFSTVQLLTQKEENVKYNQKENESVHWTKYHNVHIWAFKGNSIWYEYYYICTDRTRDVCKILGVENTKPENRVEEVRVIRNMSISHYLTLYNTMFESELLFFVSKNKQ